VFERRIYADIDLCTGCRRIDGPEGGDAKKEQ